MLWYHTDHGLREITTQATRVKRTPTDLWRPRWVIYDKNDIVVDGLEFPLEATPEDCFIVVYDWLTMRGWHYPTHSQKTRKHPNLHSAI